MNVWISFDLAITLRNRPVVIRVLDQLIQQHELDDEGEILVDEVVFQYKVFDVEEEAEILQLSEDERVHCFKAIMNEIQSICDEQESGG